MKKKKKTKTMENLFFWFLLNNGWQGLDKWYKFFEKKEKKKEIQMNEELLNKVKEIQNWFFFFKIINLNKRNQSVDKI